MAKAIKKGKGKPRSTNRFGRELMEGVRQMHEAATTGNLGGFKVHPIDIPDPSPYTPAEVRAVRDNLRLTQGMLGRILGVATETVEHWEQGLRRPSASARRLMDQLRSRPDAFMLWLLRNRPRGGQDAATRESAIKDTTALLGWAARWLSRREMARAVREAYAMREVGKE